MPENQECPYNSAAEARRIAHEYLREESIPIPDIPSELPPRCTPEAYMLDATLKPVSAAYFSRFIGQITTKATAELPDELRHPITFSPWKKLRLDLQKQYKIASQEVFDDRSNATDLENLMVLQGIRRRLRPYIRKHPERSLLLGSQTGVRVSTALLKDLHEKHSDDSRAVMDYSVRPLIELTKINESQLEIVEAYMLPRGDLPAAEVTKGRLDYKTSLLDMPMTPGARKAVLLAGEPQRHAKTLDDVTAKAAPFGCPIILGPKHVVQIWQHTAATAEARGLLG